MKGGDGDDKLVGGPGNDTLTGGKGDDYILGQSGDDQALTGDGKDNVVMSRGTDQVTVDGSGSKTLNGGSGQDTLDINYSGVTDLSALSTSYDGDSDTLTFTTQSGDVIAASNFEIFKIAGNEYSFVYNGFASSTGRQIGSRMCSKNWAGVSRASLTCLFVWTAQKSSPIYLRQAIVLMLGPSGRLR